MKARNMETCKYNLTELPEGVVLLTEENRPDKSVLKWSGTLPIPAIGTQVKVTMNKLGPGVVESYFFEHGYLGVCVKLSDAPEWHKKQSAGTQWPHSALVFGQEISVTPTAPRSPGEERRRLAAQRKARREARA